MNTEAHEIISDQTRRVLQFLEQRNRRDRTDQQYKELRRILDGAFDFAARGKGNERHGQSGAPWEAQRHYEIGKELGAGFALGQAVKKCYESEGLEDPKAAIRELQGAITYIASAILLIEKGIA